MTAARFGTVLRAALVDSLRGATLAPGFVRPDWAGYCFANIPNTVCSLLGEDARRPLPAGVFDGVGTDVEHVVVAFVDGFGWGHFRRARADHPFLDRLARRATVTPLTSLYPSETAAAVSTFHTATQPCEHGVLGWNAYVEALGGYLHTLPFTDREGRSLAEAADPAALIDERPVYDRLSADSVIVAPAGLNDSAYSGQATTGARGVGYRTVARGACRVRERLAAAERPTYCQFYVPSVDESAHRAGVAHPETDAQLAAVCAALERELVDGLDPAVAERTLLIVTADHGEVDAETTVDLGTLALDPYLRRDAGGDPIPAVGGPRNLQFYAREGREEALIEALREGLAPLDPLVLRREELLGEDLFGDREPSDRFLRRCPDVLAVPDEGFAWYDDGHLSQVGMHGGLHPDEMLVPFAAERVSAL